MGAVPSIALTTMPEVIRRFREAHPHVAISLRTNDSPRVSQWVGTQFCDLGVVAYVSRNASGIESSLIGSSPAVCALPTSHPLERKAVIGPADLRDEEFIALSLLEGTRMKVDQRFREAGIVPRNSGLETLYEATVCAMVAGGVGVSVVSQVVARAYVQAGLNFRPFAPEFIFESHLLRPKHAPESLFAQRFAQTLRDVLAENWTRNTPVRMMNRFPCLNGGSFSGSLATAIHQLRKKSQGKPARPVNSLRACGDRDPQLSKEQLPPISHVGSTGR